MDREEVPCKTHPDAPHGFCRDASHSWDRYVCECEFWEPEESDMTEEYVTLHLNAVIEHMEELEDEQLNQLVLECVKELYSREKSTEQEYVEVEYNV